MAVELRPLGVTCNILCQYCYQNPQRDAGNLQRRYDIEAMKASVLELGGPFTLFGGEPLLIPKSDLAALWKWGYEQWGRNGLQTNGTLIDPDHLALFEQYDVKVGISIDGPDELNDARWAGSATATRERTKATLRAIEQLCAAGRPPSIIITLHRKNALEPWLSTLVTWIRSLDELGVRVARLHVLEEEDNGTRGRLRLTARENIEAFRTLAREERSLAHLRFDLFQDMRRMLVGDDAGTGCVWNACDPYTTRAVQGVEGLGQQSNCGRTNKDGIDFVKADRPGFERQLALYHTPMSAGGCASCRFFLMCKGNCPGTAIAGDWRNRSEHCEVWMALFEQFEAELLREGQHPISVAPDRGRIEQTLLACWAQGVDASLAGAVSRQSPASAS